MYATFDWNANNMQVNMRIPREPLGAPHWPWLGCPALVWFRTGGGRTGLQGSRGHRAGRKERLRNLCL